MENSKAAFHQSREDMIAEFQKFLGNIEVFLLELKAILGLTRAQKKEIDDSVEKLQIMIREIPDIGGSCKYFKLVFGTIRKIWNFMQNKNA